MALASQTQTRTISTGEVAFTLEHIFPEINRNTFNLSPAALIFLGTDIEEMGSEGSMRGAAKMTQSSGVKIQGRHEFGTSANTKNMTGPWDTFNTAQSDTVRASEALWKHYSDAVTISKTDELTNRGEDEIASILVNLSRNAMSSLVEMVATDLYSGSSATAITGLDSIINHNDTGLQGVNAQSFGKWGSWGVSGKDTAAASVSFASGSFAAQGIADMRTAFINCSYGTQRPNVLFTTETVFTYYEGSLVPQERYAAPARTGDAGFLSLAFKTAPLYCDVLATSGVMYFVNTDAVKFVALGGADFQFDEPKRAAEQEAITTELMLKGNTWVKDRRKLNKLTGITA